MARVQGYTEDEVDILVDEFEVVVQRAIETACAAAAANLKPAQVLAAATATSHLGPEDVAVITQVWQEQLDDVLTPYIAELYTGSAVSVAVGMVDAFPDSDLAGVPLVPDAFQTAYLQTASNRLVNVGDELWEDVRNELLDGVAQGQSIPQLAARVQGVSQFDTTRATRIARTEVHGAAEAGSIAQVRYVGYTADDAAKEWVSTHDIRTRLSHSLADGQQVPLDEKFNVGGSLLDFPGDPSGAADEIINCRCTVVFDLDVAPKHRCEGALVAAPGDDPGTCVLPLGPASIGHLTLKQREKIYAALTKAKKGISPAYGGAAIHKAYLAARGYLISTDPDLVDLVDERQFLAAADEVYAALPGPKSKKTFLSTYDEWSQTPNGKKAIGPVATTPKHVTAPTHVTPVPPTPSPTTKLISPSPPTAKFTILDDPGPSGDGNFNGDGPWGLYGSSGVLVRAVDEHGVERFLLIQRGDKYIGSQKYKWQLPGGGADAYEDPYQAAAREFWEETAATKEYVESMVPMGEYVFTHPSGWKYTNIVATASHTFKPKVHGSTGDARWFTLQEIQEMIDNGDIVKELAPTLRQLADDLNDVAQDVTKVAHAPRVLPPIKDVPDPAQLQFTGQTLGSHGAQVWVDPATGDKWLFKPQEEFLIDLDVAMARLQSKAQLTRPAVYKITLGGKKGSIQYMFEDSKPAFPGGSFDPEKLTAEDLVVFQMEQIFDWLISNHDTHSGQWIRLADGRLYGVDKGQAFKFFGKDKLDWTYVPVTPLGSDKLTYSKIWKAFIEGKIDLSDPTQGAIGEYLERLMSIPDGTLRAIVAPYVKAVVAKFGGSKSKMMQAIVDRKNALRKDFEEFWARAAAERHKKAPQPTPPPKAPPPPPAATAQVIDVNTPLTAEEQALLHAMYTGQVDPSKIPTIGKKTVPKAPSAPGLAPVTTIDDVTEAMVWKQWLKANATKVTPAYGGAKIWKILEKVHKFFEDAPDWPTLTHSQILKILDEKGGYVGKPKTYESVLLSWMDTSSGKKTVGLFVPEDLKPTLVPTSLTPTVKPVTSPFSQAFHEADVVIAKDDNLIDDTTLWSDVVYSDKYKKGDVVAYASTNSGDFLKVEAFVNVDGKKGVYVYILKNGKWEFDEVFTDLGKLELHYDIGENKVGAKIWHSVPPKHAPASHIPGKVAGDIVTTDEIWTSKFKWNDGDVIAISITSNGEYRLVSLGNGGMRLEVRVTGDQNWTFVDSSLPDKTFYPSMWPPDSNAWKLGPSTLAKRPKPSPIIGKNEGDVVTYADIWDGTTHLHAGDVVAYARTYQDDGWLKIQFSPIDGTMEIRVRNDGSNAWGFYGAAHTKKDLEFKIGNVTWYAANADGKIPDVLNLKKSGGKKPSKMPGTYEGDKITAQDISDFADNYGEYEVIAEGVAGGGAWQWRIYQIQGIYVREAWFKFGNQGYEFDGIVDDLSQPLKGTVFQGPHQWHAVASGTKVHPSSIGAKAAKKSVTSKLNAAAKKGTKKAAAAKKVASQNPAAKAQPLKGNDTHIPGKFVDDEIDNQQIMAHYDKYEDGTIVAVTKSTWGATRVVVVDGKLVLQEQTAAKAWKNKKIVTNYWQLYGKWYASNEKLPKPQHNAAKKFVQKKITPPAAKAPSYSSYSGTSTSPTQIAPFSMRQVDISPWNDSEMLEIYEQFRTHNAYTSSNPESIWGALQATKSFFQAKYGGKYLQANEIELLRMIDLARSKKKGLPLDIHPYESKVVNWLKTPQGKFYVNRRIDAPVLAREIPEPMHALDVTPDPDKQSYKIISTAEGKSYREESHKKYGSWKPGQKESQKKYTGGSYTSWNAAIRRGDLGSYRADIIRAQQGARPSTRPMLLHRGCSFAELNDPSITSYETLLPYVGRTYTTRGFTSTSVGGTPGFSGQLIIEFECPIGTPMTYVADFSNFKSERETTLPTHLVYKILSVTKKGHQTIMRVRVLGVAQTGTGTPP